MGKGWLGVPLIKNKKSKRQRECVFGGTINAQYQSPFCQNLYIYDFGGWQGGSAHLPKKILYLVG